MLVTAVFGKITFLYTPLTLYRQHESNCVGAKDMSLKNVYHEKLFTLGIYNQIIQTKDYIKSYRHMVAELLHNEMLYGNIREELNAFLDVQNKNKIARILFYKLHKFRKKERNWWMLLWI